MGFLIRLVFFVSLILGVRLAYANDSMNTGTEMLQIEGPSTIERLLIF